MSRLGTETYTLNLRELSIVMNCFYSKRSAKDIEIKLLAESETQHFIDNNSSAGQWLESSLRSLSAGQHCLVPSADGHVKQVIVIIDSDASSSSMWAIAALALSLPEANYYLSDNTPQEQRQQLLLGWALGAYQYNCYNKNEKAVARIFRDDDLEAERMDAMITAHYLTRDLINAPPNEMMPINLAETTKALAKEFSAKFSEVTDDQQLAQDYPLVHAVGRASKNRPRLIRLSWGQASDPRVSLIGKGVCFDSGGLNIKPGASMRYMKKDMGGAAHVLGLARYIMQQKLPIQLELWVSAVENAISEDAFRPGDIIRARSGTTVEIDNTDAEGRLVMADALTEALENNTDLIIDFSTLTGAARVALGTEVGVFFANKSSTAATLMTASAEAQDPLWQLPLHQGYKHQLKSDVADLVNCASSGYGGAISAALFLQDFVTEEVDWLHFDVMAYNMRSRPGRPKGGEAMGLRAMCHYLEQRYTR
jgi:leucyl aminopeptidase